MGIQEVLSAKRSEIIALARRYGATNVRVFGSVARGDADDQSDVDDKTLNRPVDVVTEKGLRGRVRERVIREAVPI
ncbi:MAG: nucleotidyltransferase family protein [Thermoanaerobaculia bacterium]